MDKGPATPLQSSYDYLLPGKILTIGFNDNITINSKVLTEVYHYTRKFETKIPYKACKVELYIPFTGFDKANHRARILLYLDDKVICDGSRFSSVDWLLIPLSLKGELYDLKPGTHTVTLKCCVDGDTLYIPHYHKNCIEATLDPPIQATLNVVGIN